MLDGYCFNRAVDAWTAIFQGAYAHAASTVCNAVNCSYTFQLRNSNSGVKNFKSNKGGNGKLLSLKKNQNSTYVPVGTKMHQKLVSTLEVCKLEEQDAT